MKVTMTAVVIPTIEEQLAAGGRVIDPASVRYSSETIPVSIGSGIASNLRMVDGRLVADVEYEGDFSGLSFWGQK